MDTAARTELEAAAFRRLVSHLQHRTDVQNIDLMGRTGFCRNCLGDWYLEAAEANGIEMSKDNARAAIYGMPQAEWKSKFQQPATDEQVALMNESVAKNQHGG